MKIEFSEFPEGPVSKDAIAHVGEPIIATNLSVVDENVVTPYHAGLLIRQTAVEEVKSIVNAPVETTEDALKVLGTVIFAPEYKKGDIMAAVRTNNQNYFEESAGIGDEFWAQKLVRAGLQYFEESGVIPIWTKTAQTK